MYVLARAGFPPNHSPRPFAGLRWVRCPGVDVPASLPDCLTVLASSASSIIPMSYAPIMCARQPFKVENVARVN